MSDFYDCNGVGMPNDFLSLYMSKTEKKLTPQINGHATEINFTPSPQKTSSQSNFSMNGFSQESVVTNGNTFCRRDNIEECVGFLNQEVTSMGLPSLYEGKSDAYDTCRLVNCTYDLLQKYSRSGRVREELENRICRQESDANHLRETQRSLVRQLDQSQQETVQAQERERQLIHKNKTLAKKLKGEREEVKRLQSVIQHRDAQYKHELRKKEGEHFKLKDRLHRMLSDKKGGKSGMNISTVIGRQDGKRGQWGSGSKQEEELFRQVISNYEEKQKELLVENMGLRQGLNDLQKEVVKAYREASSTGGDVDTLENSQELKNEDEPSDQEDGSDDNQEEGIQDAHFQMPFEYLEGNVLKTVKDKCRQLRGHIRRIEKQQLAAESRAEKSPNKSDSKLRQSEVEQLNKDIQRYKEIIDQQDEFIQKTVSEAGSNGPEMNFLNEADILGEKENLEMRRGLFEEQKMNFDKERQTYAEATIRLHKDKQAFDEEKAAFLKNQFAQMTPFQKRPMIERHKCKQLVLPTTPSITVTQDNPHHIFKTPSCPPRGPVATPVARNSMVTPSARPPVTTPTTHDLYRHLGLTQDDDVDNGNDIAHNRPHSAGLPDAARPTKSDVVLSPSWANSGRRRPSSAVAKTTPSGDHTWAARSANADVTDHMDNIRMMLFSQQNQTVPEEVGAL